MFVVCTAAGGCNPQGRGANPAPASGPPSVILVSIDTLRADRLAAYGNPEGLTPNLDAFAREAVVFDSAYSQAAQTAPSHGSIFSSRYPAEQTTIENLTLFDPARATLAEMLDIYGYQTAGFVSGGDLSPYRHLNRGFATYQSVVDFGSLYHTTPRALEWLDGIDKEKPFFLFVHGYDTHSSYLKPTPYGYLHTDANFRGPGKSAVRTATERIVDGQLFPNANRLIDFEVELLRPRDPANNEMISSAMLAGEARIAVNDADIAHVRAVYDGAVSYGDAMFGTFMAGLEQRKILDHAVIIVMSDHGEQLGERGMFGHCCGIDDEETHTVLMMRLPKGEGGGRHVGGFVEMLDILPTVADLVGATPPAGIDGRSVYPALMGAPATQREFAHAEGSQLSRLVSVRGAAGRLTWSGLSVQSPEFADVVAAARIDGPGFNPTPADLPVAEKRELRDEMVRWARALDPPPGPAGPPQLPAALRQSLREHGYFEVAP